MADQQSQARNGLQRPDILKNVTETQVAELEAQVEENDRRGFDWRTESFGWSREEAEEVWAWMKAGQIQVEAVVEE
jgi:hypothetical protein